MISKKYRFCDGWKLPVELEDFAKKLRVTTEKGLESVFLVRKGAKRVVIGRVPLLSVPAL